MVIRQREYHPALSNYRQAREYNRMQMHLEYLVVHCPVFHQVSRKHFNANRLPAERETSVSTLWTPIQVNRRIWLSSIHFLLSSEGAVAW